MKVTYFCFSNIFLFRMPRESALWISSICSIALSMARIIALSL